MRYIRYIIAIVVLLAILSLPVPPEFKGNEDILFQTSTINALLKGVYEGDMTYAELRKHGDFGIGTFNDLDGEMVALDGRFYKIRADGKVYTVSGAERTPFASVTFFEADNSFSLNDVVDFDDLEEKIDAVLPGGNIFYAIKIDGKFDYVKTRSVPKQEKPYPPLSEITKDQPVFEFRDVEGTLVGFRMPDYVKGINVPGYHLHFISKDLASGGHLLEVRAGEAAAQIDNTSAFFMVLPGVQAFQGADLAQVETGVLKEVER